MSLRDRDVQLIMREQHYDYDAAKGLSSLKGVGYGTYLIAISLCGGDYLVWHNKAMAQR